MIKVSIDVLQLDKARFKEVDRRSGAKAKFCELVLIETPGGEYGDYMVKQDMTKEEREKGVKLPIVGNGKIVGSGARPAARPAAQTSKPGSPISDEDVPGGSGDSVPF